MPHPEEEEGRGLNTQLLSGSGAVTHHGSIEPHIDDTDSSPRQSICCPIYFYGIDAPVWQALLFTIGVVSLGLYFAFPHQYFLVPVGCSMLGAGLNMFLSSLLFKTWHIRSVYKSHLLSGIAAGPSAQILDVGTGHGLALCEAAKYLNPTAGGKAYGIDVWNVTDQLSNAMAATQEVVDRQGLTSCVELRTADARELPFENNTIDVVVSSYMLHNLTARVEREKVLSEIHRVLKPRGKMIMIDISNTFGYASYCRDSLRMEVENTCFVPLFGLPTRAVIAVKP